MVYKIVYSARFVGNNRDCFYLFLFLALYCSRDIFSLMIFTIKTSLQFRNYCIFNFLQVGGVEEYIICEALKSGRLFKPLVAWCIGTCANMFSSEVQFGHAGASANSEKETAIAKNKVSKLYCHLKGGRFMFYYLWVKQT